jgi:predicted DNA-binding ribbon-helix-helix protein
MGVKTIRDVDEETWATMKELAERERIKMGTLLKMLVKEYRKTEVKGFIPKRPILSKKEADELKSFVMELRKQLGFRL